jgi:polyhydroxyalkanoate synthase
VSAPPSPASPRTAGDRSARSPETWAERTARFWRTVNLLADATEAASTVGATPADAVFTRDRVTLWRYRPQAPLRPVPPVLIVHGFIGRASITDLAPGRSLVADLAATGVDVYTIHWGEPSRADQYMGIEDYLEDHLDACIRHAARAAGRAPVLLGVCEGGVFSTCYAALEPARLSGLALTITPIDCHAEPDAVLTRWVRAFDARELARLVDSLGGLPGPAMAGVFQAMTPGRTMAKYTTGLAELADDPAAMTTFLKMEEWLRDRPDHPGEAAKQMLIEHYHENRLARGVWSLGGRRIDLAALRLPVLNAWGLHDILVPPRCAAALGGLLPNAAYTPCPLETGHVGVFVSRRARGQLAAAMTRWLDSIAAGVNLRCQGGDGRSSDGR